MRLFYSCQGEYICKRLFVFMLQQLVRKEKKSNFPKWTLLKREVNSDLLQIWRSHCSCTLWSVWTCHPFKKRNLGYSESKKTKVLRVCFPSASGLIDWKIIWMPSGDSRSPFHSTLRLMHPNNNQQTWPAITPEGVLCSQHHYTLCLVCEIKAASWALMKKPSADPSASVLLGYSARPMIRQESSLFSDQINQNKQKQN